MSQAIGITVSDLVGLLSLRAADIALELFPAAKKTAQNVTIGSLAGEPGQSLSVWLGGAKPGNWCDFSTGERGDILDLVSQVLFSGDKGQAVEWGKRYLGIVNADFNKMSTMKREANIKRKQKQKEAEALARKIKAGAWRRWHDEATPDLAGTPVEKYLNGRGIDLARCGSLGAIRYHKELLNTEHGEFFHAMVAAIVGPDGKFMAVHRTWLEADSDGRWDKADLKEPRKTLGLYRGGYISINKGASGKTMNKAPQGDSCLLGESIEDMLVFNMARPELRIITTISISNMANVILPRTIETEFCARDNDTKKEAIEGFEKMKLKRIERCQDVRVVNIPIGKDSNAMLLKLREDAA